MSTKDSDPDLYHPPPSYTHARRRSSIRQRLSIGGFAPLVELAAPESKFLVSIIQDIQKKVIRSNLLLDSKEHLNDALVEGEELRLLDELDKLEYRYESLLQSENASVDYCLSSTHVELAKVKYAIKIATRHIHKYFSTHPSAIVQHRSSRTLNFNERCSYEHCWQEYKKIIHDRLKLIETEDSLREDGTTSFTDNQVELNSAIRLNRIELEILKSKRQELIDELAGIQGKSRIALNEVSVESEARQDIDKEVFRVKEDKYKINIVKIEHDIAEACRLHQNIEVLARQGNRALKSQLKDLIESHNLVLREEYIKFSALSAIVSEEEVQLSGGQKEFDQLQIKGDQIAERKRLEDLRDKEEKERLTKLVNAAMLIQRMFKGWICRVRLRRKKALLAIQEAKAKEKQPAKSKSKPKRSK